MIGEYYSDITSMNEDVYEKDIDVIAIGNMGCYRALPDIGSIREISEKCIAHDKRLRIYTPRVPQSKLTLMQKYISNMKDLLQQDSIELVINDIGMLLWLNQQGIKAKHLVLGSTYSWSQMQNSLFDNIIRDEREQIKKIYVQVNSNHDLRLEFYKGLNVTEMEIPNIKELLNRVERIRKHGFAISVINNYMIAGFSRSCVHVKIGNNDANNCNRECNEIILLNMDKMWDAITVSFPYFKDDENIKYYNSIYVHGNMQYRKIHQSIKGQKKQLNPDKDTLILWPEMDKVVSIK